MPKRDKYIFKSNRIKKSINLFGLIIVLSFVVLIFRLIYLQIVKGNYFLELSKRNSIRLLGIMPPRGDIVTSDGVFYAKNIPSFSVSVYKTPNLKDKTIEELSKTLNLDPEQIKEKIKFSPYYTSVIIKSDLDRKKVFELLFNERLRPFINIEVSPKRFYPGNAFSYANIAGYISEVSLKDLRKNPKLKVDDLIGRKGVEKKYDPILRGMWGEKEVQVTSSGAIVKTISVTPPIKGRNLTLTINSKLQRFLYNLLKDNSLKGSIVVIKPNGAVLAIADSDTFNPNYFIEGLTKKQWEELKKKHLINLFDIALQGSFPPGSLIKPFMALAGLKEGIIKPNQKVYCPYAVKIGRYTYRDWKKGGFGNINMYRAIESSSDVYFYQLGMKLGIDRIDFYMSKFGFGQSPMLFDYCTKGNLPSKAWKFKKYHKGWYIGDTISTAIGQGFFLSSPLQIALAFSIIANNGIGYRPYVVKSAKKEILYVFKSKYYSDIKHALWLVVNGKYGTAKNAKINGLDICGKTGTSQVVKSGIYRKVKRLLKEGKISYQRAIKYFPHAWFASFAPKDKPKVIVVVFLEHGEYSSKAAALAKIVYEKLLSLGII